MAGISIDSERITPPPPPLQATLSRACSWPSWVAPAPARRESACLSMGLRLGPTTPRVQNAGHGVQAGVGVHAGCAKGRVYCCGVWGGSRTSSPSHASCGVVA
jgi:hypothetical protein